MPEYRSRFTHRVRKTGVFAAFALVCLTMCTAPYLLAQKPAKTARKIVTTVKPAYPQTLKNLHIEGLVRLKVVVAADGLVGDIKVLGGNPILAENAVKAVKEWKFVPAASQTEEEVVLNFFDR